MLFYSDFDYADSTRIVFEEAIKQGYEARYLSKLNSTDNIPDEFKRYVISANSIKAAVYISRAKVLFLTHGVGRLPLLFFGLKIIQFWHGIPFKKILLDSKFDTKKFNSPLLNRLFLLLYKRRINLYDYVISTGEKTSNIFSSAFGIAPNRVLNLGSPRHQKMSECKLNNESVSRVLYLPTWRENREFLIEISQNLLSESFQQKLFENNIQLDISFHPFDYDYLSEHFNGHVCILEKNFNIYESFNRYDTFIVDYSSIAFDLSIVSDRVLFYLPDLLEYQAERELYIDIQEVAGELIGYDESELFDLLIDLKNKKNIYNNIKKLKYIETNEAPVKNILNFVELTIFKSRPNEKY